MSIVCWVLVYKRNFSGYFRIDALPAFFIRGPPRNLVQFNKKSEELAGQKSYDL